MLADHEWAFAHAILTANERHRAMIGFKKTAAVALLAGLALVNTAQAGLLYYITDLGTLPGAEGIAMEPVLMHPGR